MKNKTPSLACVLIITLAGMFQFATAQITTIHPSQIISIARKNPSEVKLSIASQKHITEKENSGRHTVKITSDQSSFSNSNERENADDDFSDEKLILCKKPPKLKTNFEGNPQTPFYLLPVGYYASECNIAISNSGKIVSISNGWIRYYDENGTLLFSDALYHFYNSLIDCHVLYDPKADRFVFCSQYGYYDDTTFNVYGTVLGFSNSNDPMDGWNFYPFPFTNFHDNSVGDYPLLAMSDSEIFITLDYYNSGNKYKHVEIIQINKAEGYAGSSSLISQKYDAPLTGNTKGTMVPAQGGSTTYGPNMYFIMANESGNSSNKYYVYEITNTIGSGQAVLNRYGPVTSNISYSACGTSYQPGGIPLVDLFAADDDYMENAFYENGIIQFCQITKANGKAAGLIGRISGLPNNLNCTAKTISNPDLYLCYPSIAYAGNSSADNSAIVGIEHTGTNTFPGLSAVFVNSNFDMSALTTVKAGNDTINALWGDYSGICRRYNHPGEVWFEGQYGSSVFKNINWIAQLRAPACFEEEKIADTNEASLHLSPNPLSDFTSISFSLPQSENVSIKIFGVDGKLIRTLADEVMSAGAHALTWNARDENGNKVNAGIYLLRLQSRESAQTIRLNVLD